MPVKTRVAIEEEAAAAALVRAGVTRWLTVTINETTEETYRQERRGRPGADTRYRKHSRTRHTISWDTHLDVLAYDAATDGAFPPGHQRHRHERCRCAGRLPLPAQP